MSSKFDLYKQDMQANQTAEEPVSASSKFDLYKQDMASVSQDSAPQERTWGNTLAMGAKELVSGAVGSVPDAVTGLYNLNESARKEAHESLKDVVPKHALGSLERLVFGNDYSKALESIPNITETVNKGIDEATGDYTKTPEEGWERTFARGLNMVGAIAGPGAGQTLAAKYGEEATIKFLGMLGSLKKTDLALGGIAGATTDALEQNEYSTLAAAGGGLGAAVGTALIGKGASIGARKVIGHSPKNFDISKIDAAKAAGVDVPITYGNDSKVLSGIEQLTLGTPFVGGAYKNTLLKQGEEYAGAVSKEIEQTGARISNHSNAGEVAYDVGDSLKRRVMDTRKTLEGESESLYGEASSLLKADAKAATDGSLVQPNIQPQNTFESIQTIREANKTYAPSPEQETVLQYLDVLEGNLAKKQIDHSTSLKQEKINKANAISEEAKKNHSLTQQDLKEAGIALKEKEQELARITNLSKESESIQRKITQKELPIKRAARIEEEAARTLSKKKEEFEIRRSNLSNLNKKNADPRVVETAKKKLDDAEFALKKASQIAEETKTRRMGLEQESNVLKNQIKSIEAEQKKIVSARKAVVQAKKEYNAIEDIEKMAAREADTSAKSLKRAQSGTGGAWSKEGTQADIEGLVGLKQSLSKMIDWGDYSIKTKNQLKVLRRGVEKDLAEYGKSNKEWFDAYVKADAHYGQHMGRSSLSSDTVKKILKQEDPEKILLSLRDPSDFENLKRMFGRDKEGLLFLDRLKREKLENIFAGKIIDEKTGQVNYSSFSKLMSDERHSTLIKYLIGDGGFAQLKRLHTVAQGMMAREGRSPILTKIVKETSPVVTTFLTFSTGGGGMKGLRNIALITGVSGILSQAVSNRRLMNYSINAAVAMSKGDKAGVTKWSKKVNEVFIGEFGEQRFRELSHIMASHPVEEKESDENGRQQPQ